MGELRSAVETVSRVPVELVAAGRTDAGVHGWGQVVSGRVPGDLDPARLQRSVNGLCGPEIVVREAEWADDDFDARFSASSRTYRYEVWNDPVPHPLLARSVWHMPVSLDPDAMNRAAADLRGDHDFTSFCRRPKPVDGAPAARLVRRVLDAEWCRVDGPLLRFTITATAFCHQMVRSIVGTLVDVGAGRLADDAVPGILAALDRGAAGRVAPPTGLTLWHVDYRGTRWDA